MRNFVFLPPSAVSGALDVVLIYNKVAHLALWNQLFEFTIGDSLDFAAGEVTVDDNYRDEGDYKVEKGEAPLLVILVVTLCSFGLKLEEQVSLLFLGCSFRRHTKF